MPFIIGSGDVHGNDVYLARYADCIFWMSRYLERAENLARLLDITYNFTPASMGAQNWQSIISLNCDEKAFAARHSEINANNAIHFYLIDDTHPNSLMACLKLARNSASQLRAVISTEMWVQINIIYNEMRDFAQKPLDLLDFSPAMLKIRRQCQTHYGLSEGALYRDQGWYFYLLGKHIERADQVTRLLDIKYHLLLPSPNDVGSVIDAAQWFALLRAASAYHAFRREHPYIISPATVARFLLSDRRFPRSVAFCLKNVSTALERLQRYYHLPDVDSIITTNEILRSKIKRDSVEEIIAGGLHEYLDQIQLHLIRISGEIGTHYF
jgi:uncharacterized alpha-E superfamily protein